MIKRRWTLNDETRLINLLNLKVDRKEIAKTLARTVPAIECKINELKDQGVKFSDTVIKQTVIDDLGKTRSVVKSQTPKQVFTKDDSQNSVKMITCKLFQETIHIKSEQWNDLIHTVEKLSKFINKPINLNIEIKGK